MWITGDLFCFLLKYYNSNAAKTNSLMFTLYIYKIV